MTAMYDLRENPNPKGDGEKQPLHVRIVSSETIHTRDLLEEIAASSTFSVGELEGALTALTDRMATHLKNGDRVELGKIGYFSVKLKSRPVMDKNEIRAASIEFDNVNFRASTWFRKQTRGTVERASYGFQVASQMSEKERRIKLDKYLDENAFITRTDYTNLTGRLKNKALEDLKELVNQGVLISSGRCNQLIFLRAPQK